jgi:hypothetical protein
MSGRRVLCDATGQASVEAVALLPLLAVVCAAVLAVFAAGAASEAADAAAHSAAVALLEGGDPKAAAREALEDWPRRATDVAVRSGIVTVTVRPRVPIAPLARVLEARTTTDTATAPQAPSRPPATAPAAARPEPRGGDGRSARPASPGGVRR